MHGVYDYITLLKLALNSSIQHVHLRSSSHAIEISHTIIIHTHSCIANKTGIQGYMFTSSDRSEGTHGTAIVEGCGHVAGEDFKRLSSHRMLRSN